MCFLIENMLNFSIIIHIYVVEDKQTLVSIQIYSITNDWINFIVMWLIFLEYFHPITRRMVSRCKDVRIRLVFTVLMLSYHERMVLWNDDLCNRTIDKSFPIIRNKYGHATSVCALSFIVLIVCKRKRISDYLNQKVFVKSPIEWLDMKNPNNKETCLYGRVKRPNCKCLSLLKEKRPKSFAVRQLTIKYIAGQGIPHEHEHKQ